MSENRREAVALKYEAVDGAPKVVAKGSGLIAEEIIARAKEAGVFVHESKDLVSLLMNVNLDSRIPPQLYIAVAELLAWNPASRWASGPARPCPPPSIRYQSRREGRQRRRVRALVTTDTDDRAMAAPAITGFSSPAAARGRPSTL